VAVTTKRYEGVFHGFFTEVETYTQARQAVGEACAQLRAAFGSQRD
jgi:acetyl esterase